MNDCLDTFNACLILVRLKSLNLKDYLTSEMVLLRHCMKQPYTFGLRLIIQDSNGAIVHA